MRDVRLEHVWRSMRESQEGTSQCCKQVRLRQGTLPPQAQHTARCESSHCRSLLRKTQKEQDPLCVLPHGEGIFHTS